MTDEQLDRLEAVVRETGHMTKLEAITVLADYRRLRDLERACKQLFWQDEHGAYWMSKPEYWKADERCAADAIGRLLEGER